MSARRAVLRAGSTGMYGNVRERSRKAQVVQGKQLEVGALRRQGTRKPLCEPFPDDPFPEYK
jgi:hypothetical protein